MESLFVKIVLIASIAYSDRPPMMYRVRVPTTIECNTLALELQQSPPIEDNVVKFTVGCSYEDRISATPVRAK